MTVLYPYRCYNKLCCKRDSTVLVGIANIEGPIRQLLHEKSDIGLHCLPCSNRPFCPVT